MEENKQEPKSLLIDILHKINESENIEDKEFKFEEDKLEYYSRF